MYELDPKWQSVEYCESVLKHYSEEELKSTLAYIKTFQDQKKHSAMKQAIANKLNELNKKPKND